MRASQKTKIVKYAVTNLLTRWEQVQNPESMFVFFCLWEQKNPITQATNGSWNPI